ncbi:hypothetical protein VPNG_08436 [Cytospora leucostoma]|uniref:Uncharacterized protein n=1 Tax=Cytospora leucostoma TaxID=1230097 RepID=A0A423W616_9PEZI|nr:hypothetical protein VPNG_08436 [Cytospora leucostoma]
MSEAPAEPTLGPAADTTSPKSVTTTEPTISAPKPTIYSPGDVRSTSAYPNNSQMTYLPHTFHAASPGRVGHPNTITTSQAIPPHRNASLNPPTTPAENQASSPRYGNSTRGHNPAYSAAYSGACSYCGLMGHSQDICRKQKRRNTNQTTGNVLPNIHDKPDDNKAGDRQSALGDMTMDGSSGQEPIDNDEEAHHHSSQNGHGEGPKHHMTVADPGLGHSVNEPTPKRTKTDKDARGFNDSANTKDRHKPASIIRISYAPRGALRNKEVHNPGTTVSDDFTEFQRKLMKRRREEAMRLRREQGRGHY